MLLSHTLRYLPAQLLSPLAQLVSMVLWTHGLNPAEMGVFTLVTVTQEMAYLACLSWFSVYALRYLPPASDTEATRRYRGTENVALLFGTLAGVVVSGITALLLADRADWGTASAAVAAYVCTRSASAHYAERARAQSAFLAYTSLQVCGPVLGLGFGWLALQHFPPTAWTLLLAYAAAQGVGLVLAWPLLGMDLRALRADRALLADAARFGAPMLGLGLLGWVAENYLRYLVQWQEGAAALGLMVVGWALGRRCASVASMLVTTAAFPLAARLLNDGRREEALQQLRLNAALMLAVLIPVTVGVELLGATLVALTVAEEYRELTTEMLAISMFAAALRNLHLHVTSQLMVLDRQLMMCAKVDLIEVVVCVAASFAGLMLSGLHGAVMGQALGSAVALLVSAHWARTRLGFLWPTSETVKILAATALMAVALALLKAPQTLGELVLASTIGAAVYGLAMAAMFWSDVRRVMPLLRRARTGV
jgi:O-antigen/teichoic acid export membrane protein